ncbi:MAG: HNH endonuclease [Pirellulaceae bacterium]|nr:HNH endonuclease [Pirellulaceae bacterium]
MAVHLEQRRLVLARASGCCEYCQSQSAYSADSFSVEHIIPRVRGGTEALSNLALACQGCNNRKFVSVEAADPLTGRVVPLYHPRRDHWDKHFVWSADFLTICGLTPTGRATVEKLKLNRETVVNLRRLLRGIGEHPPPYAVSH